jgi:hypothetical protein
MSKLKIKESTTSKLVRVFIQDSSSTTGAGLTGLVYNSSGLTAHYLPEGDATATAITLATMTVGTWATGGFKEVDATNMPGVYEIGLPDAVIDATSEGSTLVMLKGATNMAPVLLEIELDKIDYRDGVRAGLTALPNAAADAAGGLVISDAGGLDIDTMDSRISTFASSGVTASTVTDKTGYSISGTKTTLDDLNDVSTADVNTQVDLGLSDIGLDHLVAASVTGTDIADNSIIARMVSKSATADWDSFDNTTDALEALADTTGGDATAANQTTIINAIGTMTDLGGGADIANNLADMAGATFSSATDSLEAIRDRGDSAWVTGGAGSAPTEAEIYTYFTSSSRQDTFKADVSALATAASIAALNDFNPATDTVANVTTVATTTTNSDMRGTDNAFLAASAPTNFSDLAITASTGRVTVGTNADKTGYSISGSITTLDGLNDPTAAAIADAVLDESLAAHNTGGTLGKAIRQIKEGVVSAESTVNDASATTTSFVTALTSAVDNFYNDKILVFIGGALTGQARIISDYNGTTKAITFDEATTSAPANGDGFIILGIHQHTLTQIKQEVRSEMDSNSTQLAAIVADTNELQGDWVNGGRLDLILDSVLSLLDDARSEPGQGAPPVNPDAMTKLDYLYKAWRNKKTQTATTFSLFDDAGTTVDHKATVSDDGTTATIGEVATGP